MLRQASAYTLNRYSTYLVQDTYKGVWSNYLGGSPGSWLLKAWKLVKIVHCENSSCDLWFTNEQDKYPLTINQFTKRTFSYSIYLQIFNYNQPRKSLERLGPESCSCPACPPITVRPSIGCYVFDPARPECFPQYC